jgi:hypothetical protein
MNGKADGSSFRYRWVRTWEQCSPRTAQAADVNQWWDGRLAYRELADRIQRLLPGEGTPMLRQLMQHIRYFRRLLPHALDERKRYAAKITAFDEAAEVFKRHAVEAGPGLNADLSVYERQMRAERWMREEHQSAFWKLHLLPCDRSEWTCPTWIYGDLCWVQDFPAPPLIIERAEKIFEQVGYPPSYTSIENLHTWLQIRAAVIFKLFLSQPSTSGEHVPELTLLTTARLIVLFYRCAGFGKPCTNPKGKFFLKVGHTKRELTVGGVYEKLQRYHVDAIVFGGMTISETLTKGNSGGPSSVEALYCRNFSEYVTKLENGESAVPLTFAHAMDAAFVEHFSDGTVSVGFSPEENIFHEELASQGYTLVGICDRKGVLLNRFETSQQCAAAKLAVQCALRDRIVSDDMHGGDSE